MTRRAVVGGAPKGSAPAPGIKAPRSMVGAIHFQLPVARHGVDHHQPVVVDLKTVRGRRIAVGEMFVDQKKTQRIVAMETETKAAAPLIEIGEQPAFAVEILNVFQRRGEFGVVACRSRRDTFSASLSTRSISRCWSGVKPKFKGTFLMTNLKGCVHPEVDLELRTSTDNEKPLP